MIDEPSTVTYHPSDDLESLFYVFLEFTITYEGPNGKEVPKEKRQFPFQYRKWTNACALMGQDGAWASGLMKKNFFTERPSYKVSEYFEACYPVLEEWREAIVNALRHKKQVSHKEIREIIERGLENIIQTAHVPMPATLAPSSVVPAAPPISPDSEEQATGAL